jgi:hypothetical protein
VAAIPTAGSSALAVKGSQVGHEDLDVHRLQDARPGHLDPVLNPLIAAIRHIHDEKVKRVGDEALEVLAE